MHIWGIIFRVFIGHFIEIMTGTEQMLICVDCKDVYQLQNTIPLHPIYQCIPVVPKSVLYPLIYTSHIELE